MPKHDGDRGNPFQPAPGADPPALVGREAELASIDDATSRVVRGSAPTPIVLLGLRGLGKTVLLNVARRKTPEALHLHVEIESGVPLEISVREALESLASSVEPVHVRVRKAIDRALSFVPLPSIELPHELGAIKLNAPEGEIDRPSLPLGRAVDTLSAAASAARKPLVITIDEVQDVDVTGLRSLVASVHRSASTESPIMLACAGLPDAGGIFAQLRTYAKRWDRFELGFLTRAETAEAIRVPLRDANVTIDDSGLDRLVDESAGYPYFIQKFASAAWNRHRGDIVTTADVDAIVPDVRALVEKLFYEDEFARLTARERLFSRYLADLGPGAQDLGEVARSFGVPSSAVSSIRTNLIKKGIVFGPSPGKVEFRMPLADRYVRERGIGRE